jgi:hypothetical protein
LAVYGLIALVLILASWSVIADKAARERADAKQAAEEAEQRRLTNEANAKVGPLVAEAEAALRVGDIAAARRQLQGASTIQHANAFAEVRRLQQQIDTATDSARIHTALLQVSDEAFQQFRERGTLPAEMQSGYGVLDRPTAELAKAVVGQVAQERENRRLAQLEAERKRQEEMAQRAAEEKNKLEAARANLEQKLNDFVNSLRSAGIDGSLIKSVSAEGDTLTIKVSNAWHFSPYQIRLQAAQNLWQTWATIDSPGDLDKARIKIVDLNDNAVGGSRVFGGSLIWVEKE